MNAPVRPHRSAWPAVVLLTLLAFAFCGAAFVHLRDYRHFLERTAVDQLVATAELKVSQLALWRREAEAQARAIQDAPGLLSQVQEYLADASRNRNRPALTRWLSTLRQAHDYDRVLLLDPQLRMQLAVPEGSQSLSPAARAAAAEALKTRAATLGDIQSAGGGTQLAFDILVPLAPVRPGASPGGVEAGLEARQEALGLLVLSLDPRKTLYPLLQVWPAPSRTAETQLVRQDGEEVVFLNELRHTKAPALSLRLPTNQVDLPAAQALHGTEGTLRGIDYRNVPVLAAVRRVPESPWFLVVTLELDEVFGPMQGRNLLAGVLGFVTLFVALLGLAWQRRRSDVVDLKQALGTERERHSLAGRIAQLTKQADEIFLLTDGSWRVLEANDAALAAYGYTLAELRRMTIRKLRAPDERAAFQQEHAQADDVATATFDSRQQRKDGSLFLAETRVSTVEMDGGRYHQCLIRDITEARRQEAAARRRSQILALLSHARQSLIHRRSRDELLRDICQGAVEEAHFTLAWAGWLHAEGRALEPVARFGQPADALRLLPLPTEGMTEEPTATLRAYLEGKPHLGEVTEVAPEAAGGPAAAGGSQAVLALPLRKGGITGGVLTLQAPAGFFGDDEVAWLTELAEDVSHGLDRFDLDDQHRRAAITLARVEQWLSPRPVGAGAETTPVPVVAAAEPPGVLREVVGAPLFQDLLHEILSLVGTAVVVHDRNGERVLGLFAPPWCQALNPLPAEAGATTDPPAGPARRDGHCHALSCNRAAKVAIESGEPVEVECAGGLRIFSVPIRADGESIGAVDLGYGELGLEGSRVADLAAAGGLDAEALRQAAGVYEPRPPFLVALARQRLQAAAQVIGALVARHQALARERENEHSWRSLINDCQAGLLLLDANGRIRFGNPRAAELLGCPAESLAGRDYIDFVHASQKDECFGRLIGLVTGELTQVDTERRFVRPDGSDFWGQLSSRRLLMPDGALAGLATTITDLTVSRQAEAALRKSEDKLAKILRTCPQLISLSTLAEGRLLEVNELFPRFFGLPREQILGRTTIDLGLWQNPADRVQFVARLQQEGQVQDVEVGLLKASGERFTGLMAMAPLELDGVACIVTSILDISDRKQREDELRRASRLYALLSRVNQVMVRLRSPDELLNRVCRIAVEEGGFRLAWIGACDGQGTTLVPAAWWGEEQGVLAGQRLDLSDPTMQGSPAALVCQTRLPQVENRLRQGDPAQKWSAVVRQLNLGSGAAFPITFQGQLWGTFSVYAGAPDFFQTDEVQLLAEVASGLSFVLEHLDNERRRGEVETALHAAARDWQITFDAVADSLCLLDRHQRILRCNKATETLLQRAAPELLGRPCWEVVHGTPHPLDACPILRMQQTRQRESTELLLHGRWCAVVVDPIFGANGEYEGAVHILSDITQRKRAEAAVLESEQRFRALAESAFEGIAFTEGGVWVDLNDQLATMLGYARPELLGRPLLEVVAPESRERVAEAVRTGALEPYEHLAQRKDGHVFPVEVRVRQAMIGTREMRVTAVRDITERRQTEERLRAAEAEKRNVLDSVSELVVFHDLELRVKWANRAAADSVNLPAADLIGRHCFEIWPGRPTACEGCPVKRAMATGQGEKAEITTPDGRSWLVNGTSVRNAQGEIVGAVETALDITESKRAEEALRDSEERYRRIAETMRDLVCQLDVQGVYQYVSPSYQRVLNYPPETLLGQSAFEGIHPADRPAVIDRYQAALTSGVTLEVEFRYRHADGHYLWMQATGSLLGDAAGGCWGAVISSRDVTERRRVEALRQELEVRQAAILQTMPVVLYSAESPSAYGATWMTPNVERVTGFPGEPFLTEPDFWSRRIHPDDRDRVLAAFERIPGGERLQIEYRWQAADGTYRWFQDHVVSVRPGAEGRVEYFGLWQDVTERRGAEEALRQSESRLRTLYEHSPLGIAAAALDGRFLSANPAFCAMVGYPEEALRTRSVEDVSAPEDHAMERELLRRLMGEDTEVVRVEKRFCTRDGDRLWANVSASVIRDAGGQPLFVISVVENITDRRRAEEALRASEANLAAAQRIAHLGSWEAGLSGADALDRGSLRWSDEVFRIFGYEPGQVEATNELFLGAVHPDDRERLQEAVQATIRGEKPYILEHRIRRPDGAERVVQEQAEVVLDPVTSRPTKLVGTVQDLTDRKKMESELRQAQKLEGIGQLAGGVAHDFNNILTVILGNTALALDQTDLSGDSLDLLRQVATAAERASNLTRQLLAFSRRQPLRPQHLDLSEVVNGLIKMLRRIIGEDINLECRYAADLPPVHADAGMLEQVLLNLAVNARDAMPDGGTLAIETVTIDLDDAAAAGHPGRRAGRFAGLRVQDTGCGIPADVLPHIFEPFFTTKDVGRGTGLGLATVYGVIQQHHGWIDVASVPGQGTTFLVALPASVRAPGALTRPEVAGQLRGGKETILVVEDEDSLRALVRTCLARLGYRVLEARTGREAFPLWAEHRAAIDLVLTDLVLPEGISGLELARRLKADKAAVRVIYTSGYSPNVHQEARLVAGVNFLPKPYEPAALARIVRDVLDAV